MRRLLKTKAKSEKFWPQKGVESVRQKLLKERANLCQYLTCMHVLQKIGTDSKQKNALMTLLVARISKETKTLKQENIPFTMPSEIRKLPKKCQKGSIKLHRKKTANNTRNEFNIAVSSFKMGNHSKPMTVNLLKR